MCCPDCRAVFLQTLLMLIAWSLAGPLQASVPENPLQPADTSSPRATLNSFRDTLNDTHAEVAEVIQTYFANDNLYLTKEEHARVDRLLGQLDRAARALDLSELPAALARSVATPRVLQLKEVLDRIDLPPAAQVPDAEAMEEAGLDRWRLPGTEISIARVDQGPRAGEWLFSTETVERIPDFYAKVKELPYKPGSTEGWYERHRYGWGGMYDIVPYRWMARLPEWSLQRVLDQPVWRWIGSALVFVLAAALYWLVRGVSAAWVQRKPDGLRPMWAKFFRAALVTALMPVLVYAISEKLRLSGGPLDWLTLMFWAVFTLALTWSVWLAANILAETIVSSQQLRVGSIDSQLVRLGLKLVAVILGITILVVGAQQLGIPAYSVIAGLGVGGVAVALAARDSLANLLGSLLIMFEKPFRVGHYIRVNDAEGNVEGVGFRSTRIRTFYNSLVSIPNNRLVNSTVDNLGLREYHRVRTLLRITLDTPAERLNKFTGGIKRIIEENPHTRKDYYQVVLHDIGEQSLDVLLNFFLKVPDWATEVAEREKVLLSILNLAEELDVHFAFPTRSLHLETLPDALPDRLKS